VTNYFWTLIFSSVSTVTTVPEINSFQILEPGYLSIVIFAVVCPASRAPFFSICRSNVSRKSRHTTHKTTSKKTTSRAEQREQRITLGAHQEEDCVTRPKSVLKKSRNISLSKLIAQSRYHCGILLVAHCTDICFMMITLNLYLFVYSPYQPREQTTTGYTTMLLSFVIWPSSLCNPHP